MFTLDINPSLAIHTARIEDVVFEQTDAYAETTGSGVFFEPQLPDWFFQGLADCRQNRVVDMDVALNEPPPSE